jgi:sulfur dioxygenase
VTLMNNLNLPNPKMMDVAVPANMRIGLAQQIVADRGWALSAEDAKALLGDQDVALMVRESLQADGLLQQLARSSGKRLILLRLALGHGGAGGTSRGARGHIHGGIQAWKEPKDR